MEIKINENTPESRLMFEHHIHLVSEVTNKGNLILKKGMKNHGLDKVRNLPNGRVDMLTINEGARSIINMIGLEKIFKSPEDER